MLRRYNRENWVMGLMAVRKRMSGLWFIGNGGIHLVRGNIRLTGGREGNDDFYLGHGRDV